MADDDLHLQVQAGPDLGLYTKYFERYPGEIVKETAAVLAAAKETVKAPSPRQGSRRVCAYFWLLGVLLWLAQALQPQSTHAPSRACVFIVVDVPFIALNSHAAPDKLSWCIGSPPVPVSTFV